MPCSAFSVQPMEISAAGKPLELQQEGSRNAVGSLLQGGMLWTAASLCRWAVRKCQALPDTRRCLAILVSIGPARARISLETQWNKPLLKTCCWFLFFKLETCRQSILNNDFTNSMVEWLPKNSFCGTSEGPSTLLRQGHLHKSFRISLSYYTWMPPIQA